MSAKPFPLFDTFKRFNDLISSSVTNELPIIIDYLAGLPCNLRPVDSYIAVRAFLTSYSGNEDTYNSFRTYAERILLWSLLVAKKPLLEINELDVENFVAFCFNPPHSWVGASGQCRFIRVGGRKISAGDSYKVNQEWRPFNYTTPKRAWQLSNEQSREPGHETYEMSETSLQKMLSACSLLFKHHIEEGLLDRPNPILSAKKKYKNFKSNASSQKFMSRTQWGYVLRAAETMESESMEHETALFIIATSFFMCMKVSDMAGWGDWQPRMSDLHMDRMGSWWCNVPCKTGKFNRVSVRDEYLRYLKRYRVHLAMVPLPARNDDTPLLTTVNGDFNLSELNIRRALYDVLVKAIGCMKSEGCSDERLAAMQSASTHWLRGTLKISSRQA